MKAGCLIGGTPLFCLDISKFREEGFEGGIFSSGLLYYYLAALAVLHLDEDAVAR